MRKDASREDEDAHAEDHAKEVQEEGRDLSHSEVSLMEIKTSIAIICGGCEKEMEEDINGDYQTLARLTCHECGRVVYIKRK